MAIGFCLILYTCFNLLLFNAHFVTLVLTGNSDALLALVKAGAEISQQDKDGLSGKSWKLDLTLVL